MRRPDVPFLPGVLEAGAVADTAATIAAVQEPAGGIPWFPGGHVDPWDHVECAMALSAAGRLDAADRAYRWLLGAQRPDGTWPMRMRGGVVEDDGADTNFTAYVAVGAWHHWLVTRSERFAAAAWRAVRPALDFVTSMQTPRGEIRWARDRDGGVAGTALLAGCASIHQSLRCGLALADLVGEPQPDWELALGRLRHAVLHHPEAFADHDRFSMDWYYPVLGGVLRGEPGRERLRRRWDEFVVPGFGARCVADRPWVTGAETCELALALHTTGETDGALGLLDAMQHLRDPDGSYGTGYVFDDAVRWPAERSTWTAAAVILAADALSGASPGARLFVGNGMPWGLEVSAADCACLDRVPGGAEGA